MDRKAPEGLLKVVKSHDMLFCLRLSLFELNFDIYDGAGIKSWDTDGLSNFRIGRGDTITMEDEILVRTIFHQERF